jgi:hypothetical protein
MGFPVTARCGLLAHPSNAHAARLGYLFPPLFNNIRFSSLYFRF